MLFTFGVAVLGSTLCRRVRASFFVFFRFGALRLDLQVLAFVF